MKLIFILISISIVILALCFAGLAINIIVKKKGQFPETEIGRNKHMRQLGIHCARQEEFDILQKTRKQNPVHDEFCKGCSARGGCERNRET